MLLSEYKKHKEAKLNNVLLWDIDLNIFNFQSGKRIVTERVVEYGNLEDWYAILNMYGVKAVKDVIKNINIMTSKDLNFVHRFLNIPLNNLKSYHNKLSGKKHWRE